VNTTIKEEGMAEKLTVEARPNPTNTFFTVISRSNKQDPLTVRVLDVLGRVVEVRNGIAANSSFTLGHKYLSGMYYVEVIQGKDKITLKLIKQSN
jgi:hypothetical protein